MWKRFRSDGEIVALSKEDTTHSTNPVAYVGGAILDTETGLITHSQGAKHNHSQKKYRPGSYAHYAGVAVAMVCLYILFISCLPSPRAAFGAGIAQHHPLPRWIYYFLHFQAEAELAPAVQDALASMSAALQSSVSPLKEEVLPPAAEIPSAAETKVETSASAAAVDACAGVKWRPDELVGKCFGLEPAPVPGASKSWEACRDYCCEAKEACITWQYQSIRGCVVGGGVRLGLELAAPSAWCEETSPRQLWQGRHLTTRSAALPPGDEADSASAIITAKAAAAATCSWSAEELPLQCFGLGPERVDEAKKDSPTKGRLTLAGCQQWCCDHEACQTWQWREDKGCFGGKEGHCEKDNEPYLGGRKCVEGSC
eukprot:evm.model.NODE_5774_length_13239_cov_27.488331.1